jgi:hypothetical protein
MAFRSSIKRVDVLINRSLALDNTGYSWFFAFPLRELKSANQPGQKDG